MAPQPELAFSRAHHKTQLAILLLCPPIFSTTTTCPIILLLPPIAAFLNYPISRVFEFSTSQYGYLRIVRSPVRVCAVFCAAREYIFGGCSEWINTEYGFGISRYNQTSSMRPPTHRLSVLETYVPKNSSAIMIWALTVWSSTGYPTTINSCILRCATCYTTYFLWIVQRLYDIVISIRYAVLW